MEDPAKPGTVTRNDRAGLKTVVAFVEPQVSYEIKVAAAKEQSTVQKIVEQAVRQWLERYKAGDPDVLAEVRSSWDARVKGDGNPGRAMPEPVESIARKA